MSTKAADPQADLQTLANEAASALGIAVGSKPIEEAMKRAYEAGLADAGGLTPEEVEALRRMAHAKPAAYQHFSDVLTDDVLDSIAAQATEHGDIVMAMRCAHAKTDGLALRDVAICLEEQWAAPMTTEEREGLSDGIKWLVLGLQAAGFHTCDSGDGSNYEDGMSCALPFRHVAIQCALWQDPEAETERVRRYLAWIGADDEFEADLADVDGASAKYLIIVEDKRAGAIMDEVGYKGVDPADYEHGSEG